jgi:putative nucleotidyltransferase with HDIG domain
VGSAWLLTPASYIERIPGEEALGTPAAATIKAPRDYDILDEESTSRLREEAARLERPVYDLDVEAGEQAAARIREAFERMRAAGAAVAAPRAPEALEVAYAAQRPDFLRSLQVVVRDDDFARLADHRFSGTAEGALIELVTVGLAGMVVQDRELLALERGRGLVARELKGGVAGGEKVVSELAGIRDATQARDDVEKAAARVLPALGPKLSGTITRLAMAAIRPTLSINSQESERRRRSAADRVKPAVIQIRRGEKIIGDGERIEKRHLLVLRGIRAQRRPIDLARIRLGGGLLVALLVGALWSYARAGLRAFAPAAKDAVLLAGVLLGSLSLAAGAFVLGDALRDRFPFLTPEVMHALVPVAAGAMLIRAVLSAEAALLLSLASALGMGLISGHSVFATIQILLTSVVAARQPPTSRGGVLSAGLAVGITGAAVAIAAHLFAGRGSLGDWALPAMAALVSGVFLLPVLVSGLMPLVEAIFGYVTDARLLELANLNHPALKELIVKAPGTYHHSIVMGALVESGANAIGANGLLAKVCAYYHDIGKAKNPLYFAENQKGENKHDGLNASMSALIIKRHVADGMEMARQYRLPRVVADAIPQHHGTRLVGYFWAKAQKTAQPGEALEEAQYRYGGPRPMSRETALVMLADACEASCRAIVDPNPEKLRATVRKRLEEIFSEGELDECDLTLRDLSRVAEAFARSLEALQHARPEYPPREGGERGATIHVLAK